MTDDALSYVKSRFYKTFADWFNFIAFVMTSGFFTAFDLKLFPLIGGLTWKENVSFLSYSWVSYCIFRISDTLLETVPMSLGTTEAGGTTPALMQSLMLFTGEQPTHGQE